VGLIIYNLLGSRDTLTAIFIQIALLATPTHPVSTPQTKQPKFLVCLIFINRLI